MTQQERKDRVQYLWKRLRIVVKHKGLIHRLMQETYEKERKRYGLDPNISQRLNPDQELENMIVFENQDQALTDLPWYIVNPQKPLYKVQNTQI